MNTVSYGLDIGKYLCCFPKKGDKLAELSEPRSPAAPCPREMPCSLHVTHGDAVNPTPDRHPAWTQGLLCTGQL